ncbi:hypothetical protein J3R83DRAFT_14049 [Lanmaoa asiatica]|nr:hypothetical protein J3R83DRAFT_14049 [Lanmaoa asiatica]
MPRFIISVRELYDHDPRRRWQGTDTGFGLLLQPIASQNVTLSAITFADVTSEQGQIVEGIPSELEEIRLEGLENDVHRT